MYNIPAETAERVAGGEALYTLFNTVIDGKTYAITAAAFTEGSVSWNRSVTDGVLQLGTVISSSLTATLRKGAKLWVQGESYMEETNYRVWQIEDLQDAEGVPAADIKSMEMIPWVVSVHIGVPAAIEAAREAAVETEDPEDYDRYGYSNNTLVTPLGVFYISTLTQNAGQYEMAAYDELIHADRPVDWSLFDENTKLWSAYKAICTECDLGNPYSDAQLKKFNHADMAFSDISDLSFTELFRVTSGGDTAWGTITYRQLLGFIAQEFGKAAYIDRLNNLRLGWADSLTLPAGEINPSNRFSFTAANSDVKISGWSAVKPGGQRVTVYPDEGDRDGLVYDLGNNPLCGFFLPEGGLPPENYTGWRDYNLEPGGTTDTVFRVNKAIRYRPFEASILCDLRYDPLDRVTLKVVNADDDEEPVTLTYDSYILETNVTINGDHTIRCPEYVNTDTGNGSVFSTEENREINTTASSAAGNVFDNSFGSAFNTAFGNSFPSAFSSAFSTAFSAAIGNVIQAEFPVVDNPSGYVQVGAALFQYGWVSLTTTTTSAEYFWITMPKHFDDLLYGLSLVPRVGAPNVVSLSEAPTGSPNQRKTNQFRVAITRTSSVSTGTNTTVFWAAYGKASTTQA